GCCGERAARYWFRLIRGSPEADSSECLNASERTRLDATPGGGCAEPPALLSNRGAPGGLSGWPQPGLSGGCEVAPSTLSSPQDARTTRLAGSLRQPGARPGCPPRGSLSDSRRSGSQPRASPRA